MLETAEGARVPRSLQEAWEGPPQPQEYLVLLTAPYRDWWKPGKNYYWRSRLLVGDLQERTADDILLDFRKLLRQTPPVQRNWRNSLDKAGYEGKRWHLVWGAEVTLLQ
jgi:hypothetical protein